MDIKELRIGNHIEFVFSDDSIVRDVVRNLHQKGVNAYATSLGGIEVKGEYKKKERISGSMFPRETYIRPIPLTEEWLKKFGFKKFKNYNDWSKGGFILHGRKRGFVLRKSAPDVKSVHQLQNLYFALTGEELKTKKL